MKLLWILISSALILAACGGGGTTTPTPTPQPTTLTVAGKVLKWTGKPVADVPVFVTDATGSKPQVLSGSDGSFSVANVQKPYSISAVPAADSGLFPYTVSQVSITNPQVVLNSGFTPNFGSECNPVPSDTNLNLSFPAVGAGNTAKIYFVAKGINYTPTNSNKVSAAIPPGTTQQTIPLTFDKNLCLKELSGKVVYLERDSSGTILKKGAKDVTLLPGNPSSGSPISITPGNVTDVSFKGTLQLPQGVISASVQLFMKIGSGVDSVYAPIADASVAAATPSFELKTVNLNDDGISFRVLAVGSVSWVWSDVFTGSNSNINLVLPGSSATITPNGDTPGGNVNPTFSYNPVNGMNFYNTLLQSSTGGSENWLGGTPQTLIKLPTLSAPAQIALNKAYKWYPITAINLRDATPENVSDKILDGRAIRHSLFGGNALGEPDLIAAGSTNGTGIDFKILP